MLEVLRLSPGSTSLRTTRCLVVGPDESSNGTADARGAGRRVPPGHGAAARARAGGVASDGRARHRPPLPLCRVRARVRQAPARWRLRGAR